MATKDDVRVSYREELRAGELVAIISVQAEVPAVRAVAARLHRDYVERLADHLLRCRK